MFKGKRSNRAHEDSIFRDNVTTAMNSTNPTNRTNNNTRLNIQGDKTSRMKMNSSRTSSM